MRANAAVLVVMAGCVLGAAACAGPERIAASARVHARLASDARARGDDKLAVSEQFAADHDWAKARRHAHLGYGP